MWCNHLQHDPSNRDRGNETRIKTDPYDHMDGFSFNLLPVSEQRDMSAWVFINPLIYIPLPSAQNLQREIRDEYSSRISNMYGRLFKDAIKFLLGFSYSCWEKRRSAQFIRPLWSTVLDWGRCSLPPHVSEAGGTSAGRWQTKPWGGWWQELRYLAGVIVFAEVVLVDQPVSPLQDREVWSWQENCTIREISGKKLSDCISDLGYKLCLLRRCSI